MPRKKQLHEEAVEKARLARRIRYAKLKADPALYALQKEKEKKRYIKRKEERKVISASELTPMARELQRMKWRESYRKQRQKKLLEKESSDEYIIPESMNVDNVDDNYGLIIWGGYGTDIKRRL